MSRGLAIAAVTLSTLALAAAASAGGGAQSTIKIEKLSSTGAAGEVRSGRASCVGERKVSLFVLEGFITDKLAITHTNSKGEWRIRRRLEEGVYFAKVEASRGCRYDNSRRKRLTI